MENQFALRSDADLFALAGVTGLGALDVRQVDSASTAELVAEDGYTERRAEKVKAILELGKRWLRAGAVREADVIVKSESAWEILRTRLEHQRQESFVVLTLDAKRAVLDIVEVSRGTLTSSLVHPREVFRPAVKHAAAAVIFAHNHPSGDPKPSKEDRALTVRLQEAGEILGIQVLDHIVVGDGRYISFADMGWMAAPKSEKWGDDND